MSAIWLLILGALQVADIVSTVVALRKGAAEANPLLRALQSQFGNVTGAVLAKLTFALVIGALQWRYGIPTWSLALICGVYALVVINNIQVIRK